jgi:EAL and modified HD-GYP domain-containing signal transduction protein
MTVWGYLLLHRHTQEDSWATYDSAYDATASVLACLPFLSGCLPPDAKTLIHFPPRCIREDFPVVLPADRTIMVVHPSGMTGPEDLAALRALKAEGYRLALDHDPERTMAPELLEQADILICDALASDYAAMRASATLAHDSGALAMAKKIEDADLRETAMNLGFDLLHGFFFTKTEIHSSRTIPSAAVSRLRLFDLLLPDEPDFEGLAQAIEPDLALTYRLLTFLNSAHFSFSQHISSVRQAVVLGGWRPIRNWLRIILLTDLEPNRKNRELGYLSAHRAKFLENVARASGREGLADSLFLVGLFSLLDAVMRLPMEQVLAPLSLASSIRRALLTHDGPLAPWLDLATTIEAGDWDALGQAALGLDLPPGSVAESYRVAFQWADEFFGISDRSEDAPPAS